MSYDEDVVVPLCVDECFSVVKRRRRFFFSCKNQVIKNNDERENHTTSLSPYV